MDCSSFRRKSSARTRASRGKFTKNVRKGGEVGASLSQDRGLFRAFAGFVFFSGLASALCVLSGNGFLINLFLGHNGVFDTVTVIFYGIALFVLVRDLAGRWRRPVRDNAIRVLLAGICVFLIGEEVRWGLPILLRHPEDWPVLSVQDAIDLAFGPPAKDRPLSVIAIVSGVRLAFLLTAFYAGVFIWVRRAWLRKVVQPRIGHALFPFIAAFVVVTIVSLTVDMSGCYNAVCEALEEPLEAVGAAAFLLGAVSALPGGLRFRRDVSDEDRATIH